MNQSKPFQWAFIGAGKMAETAANAIKNSNKHNIYSVYTRTFSNAENFAQKYGANAYKTLNEAVSKANVDCVYISTTHNSHYILAKSCLELGKPVLLEKPFAVSAKEAKELFQLAKEKGLYITEAMWTWFSSVSRQVKKWVQNNLGEINRVIITYITPIGLLSSRLKDPSVAGGVLLDCGVYPITYCYNLFGMPMDIKCIGKVKNGIDWNETVTLFYPNNFKIDIKISMNSLYFKEKLFILGEKGKVSNPSYHSAQKATFIGKDGKRNVFKGNGKIDNEFDIVAQEISCKLTCSTYVPPVATINCLSIMDECRHQMGLTYKCEL